MAEVGFGGIQAQFAQPGGGFDAIGCMEGAGEVFPALSDGGREFLNVDGFAVAPVDDFAKGGMARERWRSTFFLFNPEPEKESVTDLRLVEWILEAIGREVCNEARHGSGGSSFRIDFENGSEFFSEFEPEILIVRVLDIDPLERPFAGGFGIEPILGVFGNGHDESAAFSDRSNRPAHADAAFSGQCSLENDLRSFSPVQIVPAVLRAANCFRAARAVDDWEWGEMFHSMNITKRHFKITPKISLCFGCGRIVAPMKTSSRKSPAAKKSAKTIKPAGHAGHTKDAATSALPGRISRSIKITMLGAGSGFTPRLVNDVLRISGIGGGTIALVDIDESRLTAMTRLIRKLIGLVGARGWKVVASTDRKAVMANSDYLVNCIEVSGLECVRHDNDIPLKYGVDQCIGDTIGPGGLFKALRTIPVFLDVLRDAERLCPQAMMLNYTNPMNMLCLAAGRTSSIPVVGLCHSVQGSSQGLANYAGVPYEEMEWDCAGINHLAWFVKARHKGRDLYPAIQERFRRDLAEARREYEEGLVELGSAPLPSEEKRTYKQTDLIRKDMCLHFGAYITESSGHLSEYLPYYRNNPEGRKLLRNAYDGGPRFYATNWPDWRAAADQTRRNMLRGTESIEWKRSWEYASWIIEAREKNAPFVIHGNVMNQVGGAGGALITNLPSNGCVEVACLVDGNGIQPTRYGALPAQMAGVCLSNMAMFDLGAQAAIDRSVEAAIHALLLDPYTSAVCSPSQIQEMTLELFRAEKAFLPGYR